MNSYTEKINTFILYTSHLISDKFQMDQNIIVKNDIRKVLLEI